MRLVVDASVAAKWFFPEPYDLQARRLLTGEHEMFAPELWLAELGNVVWVKVRRGEADLEQASAIVATVLRMPVRPRPLGPLLPRAVEVSVRLGHPIYDCLYLALREREMCQLVTTDDRLRRAARAGGMDGLIVWIGDVP